MCIKIKDPRNYEIIKKKTKYFDGISILFILLIAVQCVMEVWPNEIRLFKVLHKKALFNTFDTRKRCLIDFICKIESITYHKYFFSETIDSE